ncbi:restriction endonuclease subunit S [Pseudomonas sp. Xaverov 259]|uniref:restriction endonuclease subunit S n=1 Tax=Pseudomonas sp. Xaverov 259 TaxID=2666086 RepID=UPI00214BA640|nr:restriction endonuclease subunit S [Pseudomonas sp. Xaverov 259]
MSSESEVKQQKRVGGRPASTGIIEGSYALSVGMPSKQQPIEGWKWTPLSSIARLESGHTPSRKYAEYWGGDVPWLGIRDATGNHGLTINKTLQYTNALGIANSSARILPKHTVCLSRTASVGYVVVMGCPMATSQDFVNWVCSPKLDYRYLKYILFAEHESMLRFASGTTHQTIYFPEAKAFHVLIPGIEEQRRIADFLQSLDERITLLRETNTTLEAITQALFKSWFVDFDPVRANAEGLESAGVHQATAALFPDSFEESELGLIPKGWATRPIYGMATYINGAAYKAFEPNSDYRGLPIIKIAELKAGVTSKTAFSDKAMPEKYLIKTGDILFSWSGNPDTSIGTFVWGHATALLNQHIFRVLPHASSQRSFILQALRYLNPVFAELARNKQTTGLGHVTVADLKRLKVVSPPESVIEKFNDSAEPIHQMIFGNEQQAQTLTQIRDTLLPRLISGQLRLADAEGNVKNVLSEAI